MESSAKALLTPITATKDTEGTGTTARSWQSELFVCFMKFEDFHDAIEICGVPCDCLDEAGDMWCEWCRREYVTSVNAFN